jgi:MYXO-CTERM domain-containing protein
MIRSPGIKRIQTMKLMKRSATFYSLLALCILPCQAAVLFSDVGEVVASSNVTIDNTLSRNDSSTDTLYFRYTVFQPASNTSNENYFAALQLHEGGDERVGVGNAWGAHAYSAFGTTVGDVDLNSANPEAGEDYQLVRSADITTIVFRIDYVASGVDNITVWLNPDFGLAENAQPSALTTTFTANATFNNLRLRHGNSGSWDFRDISVSDTPASIGFIPEPSAAMLGGLGLLALFRRRR